MRLEACTWKEVDEYLKGSKEILVPIGSTEQHGPTGLIGTDFLTAHAIANEVGEKRGWMVAPVLPYGMASHHLAFSGSVSLRPSVYLQVLCEIVRSLYHHGFRRFMFVNGHGGNESTVRAAFQELKHENLEGASFQLVNWWKMGKVASIADELFGDKEGSHATPTEVSLTFFLEKVAPRPYHPVTGEKTSIWPLSAAEVRKAFPDGAMFSDPGLARAEYGQRIMDAAVNGIIEEFGKAASH